MKFREVVEGKNLNVFDKHQITIAKKTLRMSDVGASIMGGMTKDEARAVLKKHGIKINEGFDSENRVFEMYKSTRWKGKESQSDRVNYLLSQPGYKFLKKENGVVFLELTGTNGVKVTITVDKKGVKRVVNESESKINEAARKSYYAPSDSSKRRFKFEVTRVVNKFKKNNPNKRIELRFKTSPGGGQYFNALVNGRNLDSISGNVGQKEKSESELIARLQEIIRESKGMNKAKNDEKNSGLKALYKKKIYDLLNKSGGSSAKKNDVMAKIELREKKNIVGNAPDREAFNAAWDELKNSKEVEKKLAVTMI